MDSGQTRSTTTIFAYLARWCDGLWLCVGFSLAFLIAFSIPAAALSWAAKAAGSSELANAVKLFGATFLTIASPVVLSRVFRELDYSGGRGRERRRQPSETSPPNGTVEGACNR